MEARPESSDAWPSSPAREGLATSVAPSATRIAAAQVRFVFMLIPDWSWRPHPGADNVNFALAWDFGNSMTETPRR